MRALTELFSTPEVKPKHIAVALLMAQLKLLCSLRRRSMRFSGMTQTAITNVGSDDFIKLA